MTLYIFRASTNLYVDKDNPYSDIRTTAKFKNDPNIGYVLKAAGVRRVYAGKVWIGAKWPIRPALNSGFYSRNQNGFAFCMECCATAGITPRIKFASTVICTPRWREAM